MSVKGLRKIIYPFAPDQSGAASVLYELGGMIIIVDAGGCAGNICGFDEPRWLGTKSAIFSAGLRDMDAIMGRDDLMIDKIAKASKKLDAKFIAIIGTPVPATIATDYRALRRMAKKRTGLPVITMDTSGAGWYDEGLEKAYLELFREFGKTPDGAETGIVPGSAGVIGVTPLDSGRLDAPERITELLAEKGTRAVCYGAGGLEEISKAHRMEKNIVTAPSGLAAARWLRKEYGTPYECFDPLAADAWGAFTEEDRQAVLSARKLLIIHQQIRANTLRDIIRSAGTCSGAEIHAATWFMQDEEIKEEGDFRIREEQDFFDIIQGGGYDVIIADGSFRKAARDFGGRYTDMPHFAVSGVID